MCAGCYAEYGFPKIVTPETKAAAKLAEKVYEFSCVGGNLHCELDDWNLDDNFFENQEMNTYHSVENLEQLTAERECYAALKALPLDERVSAVALWSGYLREDGTLDPSYIDDEAAWLAELAQDDAAQQS